MKTMFKYIGRKIDERIANKIKDVRELIETVNDIMKDKDDLRNFGMIFLSAGLGSAYLGACMIFRSKSMQ